MRMAFKVVRSCRCAVAAVRPTNLSATARTKEISNTMPRRSSCLLRKSSTFFKSKRCPERDAEGYLNMRLGVFQDQLRRAFTHLLKVGEDGGDAIENEFL